LNHEIPHLFGRLHPVELLPIVEHALPAAASRECEAHPGAGKAFDFSPHGFGSIRRGTTYAFVRFQHDLEVLAKRVQ
jgi:hypothetical protein